MEKSASKIDLGALVSHLQSSYCKYYLLECNLEDFGSHFDTPETFKNELSPAREHDFHMFALLSKKCKHMFNISQKYSANALKIDPKSLQDRPRGPKKRKKSLLKFDRCLKRVWRRVWWWVWRWFGGGLVVSLRHGESRWEGGEG